MPITVLNKWLSFKEAVYDPRLSETAKVVFWLLLDHCNRQTRQCNPSEPTLARALGKCPRTVSNCIRELEAAGLVFTQRKKGKSNQYDLKIQRVVNGRVTPEEKRMQPRQFSSAKPYGEPLKKKDDQRTLGRRDQAIEGLEAAFIGHVGSAEEGYEVLLKIKQKDLNAVASSFAAGNLPLEHALARLKEAAEASD